MALGSISYGRIALLGLSGFLVAINYLLPRRPSRLIHRPYASTRLESAFFNSLKYMQSLLLIKNQQEQQPQIQVPKLTLLKNVHKLFDIVERFMLPLSCQGVCYQNPPHGAAIVHAKTMELLVATSSEVHANPLHVPEYLAIESAMQSLTEGSLSEGKSPGAASPTGLLHEYLLLISHPLTKLAHEAVMVSGIRTVYVLFPDQPDMSESSPSTLAPNAATLASPATLPRSALSPRKQVSAVPISPLEVHSQTVSTRCSDLPSSPRCSPSAETTNAYTVTAIIDMIGPIPSGRRMFDSQEEMDQSFSIDSSISSAQTRLIVIGSIYQRLLKEISC